MDHKVSKDMISSGMTPSGEKTQADLGRTQYGSAPSPSKLMDAYESMYQNQKQENLDEKIDPMNLGKSKRTLQQKQDARKNKQIELGNLPAGASKGARGADQGKVTQTGADMGSDSETTTKKQKKDTQSKGFGESNVDLLAAYYAVYEHHQKDENGNTIPHEDDVKEGKIPAGLQAYLDKKKGKKDDKEGKKEDVKEYAALATGALKMVGAKKAAAVVAKKGVMKSTALAANRAKNTAVKKVKDIANDPRVQSAAISSVSSGGGGQDKEKTGMVSASADLFDIVKGQLLDEGLSEEEIRDIMLTLTPDEIMKEMNQGPSTPVSIDKVEFPKPGKKVMPKTGATYIGKVRPKPGFKMNPASGEVEKNENV